MATSPLESKQSAIVLLSGGLDSTTCLAYALHEGYQCHALSFRYGQRHHTELEAATEIAREYHVPHHVVSIPIQEYGGSALTDSTQTIVTDALSTDIPNTYVPARNTIFLSIALGWAEALRAQAIFIGVSAIDYSGYPDCRPEFIDAFQKMAALATKEGVEGHPIAIKTPLIHLNKAQTIQLGTSLNVDYGRTVSCYQLNATQEACGRCDSCLLRKKGFDEAMRPDPTRYTT